MLSIGIDCTMATGFSIAAMVTGFSIAAMATGFSTMGIASFPGPRPASHRLLYCEVGEGLVYFLT